MLFIFDENFPIDFVHGLAILEKANRKSPFPVEVLFSNDFMGTNGSTDEDIIVACAGKNAVIVTHDNDFKRIKHYKPLLVDNKVGYIYFKVPKGRYEYWDIVKAFVNRWEDIKTSISKSTHPFAFEISKQGQISPLSF